MNSLQPNRKYRHYKGNDYQIIALGKHTETGEDMVVYRALYGDSQIWVHPKEMFLSNVNVDGKVKPRFHQIEGTDA